VAGACAVGAAVVWLTAYNLVPFARIDQRTLAGFVGLLGPDTARPAMRLSELVDPRPFALFGAAILLLALARRRPRSAIAIAATLAGANVTTQLLKPALAQAPIVPGMETASWPSGHATAAMALALCLQLAVPQRWRPTAAALGGLFVLILFIPSLVPLVLGLKKMPPGPLRDRLEAAARRIGVRYRHLYVWDTRGNLATAMVTGLVPRFRQIVFTDLLLQTLSDDEVEAVFGHEVGHVRHGHLLYYAVFLLLSFLTLGAAYRAVELTVGRTLLPEDLLLVLSVVATGCYLFLVFGFVSRRCERQADVFGCKAVSCADPNCSGHQPDTALVARGKGLCRTGVGTFVRALERVEEINGSARGAVAAARRGLFGRVAGLLRIIGVGLATWQHSTIARRVAFLRTLAEDPKRERRFQWGLTALRWVLLLVLAGGILAVAARSGWRSLLEGV